ncbi:MAG: ATP-binding protein [Flammeovirgaceae bacterium]
MGKKAVNTFFTFLISITVTLGQSYQVNKYQAIDGMPNELVKSIAKDPLGFIWAATDNGLVRFDGTHYEHVLDGLPSKYVKGVFKRKNGQLIASTDLGIVEIISKPDSVYTQLLFNGSSQKSDTALWYPKSFYEDQSENLWISDNHAVFRLSPTSNTLERFPMPEKVIPNGYNRSFSFVEDGNGQLFAFSETGFYFYFDSKANKFNELEKDQSISSVSSAISPQKGIVWIATNRGLVQYSSTSSGKLASRKVLMANANIAHMVHINAETIWAASWWNDGLFEIPIKQSQQYTKVEQYPASGASQILIDQDQFWFATDNGLVLMKNRLFSPKFTAATQSYIQHVIEGENALYFTDGQQVFEVQGNDPNFSYKKIHQSKQGVILRLCPTAQGLWIADTEGFLSLIHNKRLVKTIDLRKYGKTIFILEQDVNGKLWVCQDGFEGVIRLNPKTNEVETLSAEFASKIIVIKKGDDDFMYFGGTSDSAFLYRYNPVNHQIENLSLDIEFEHHVNMSIEDIDFGKDGSTWLASKFGLLHIKNRKLHRIDLGALTEETVKAISIDQNGAIWFANSNGLVKYTQNSVLVFDEKNGLSSKIIGYRCITTDSKNQLWCGTANGITYNINKQRPQQTKPPLLASLESRGNKISLNTTYKFTDNDYLKVNVVSTEYPSEFISYEYRVLGLQPNWIPISVKKELFLTNLPAGKYELQIRSKQQGNYLWSMPLQVPFQIYKVWYRTWWGMLCISIGLITLVWGAVKLNSSRLEYEKQKLEQIIADRTKEIIEKQNEILVQNEELEQQRHELESAFENLKATQTQLIQAEKLSSIGELTAGVSHEINNPLNFIAAGSNTLEDLLKDIYEIIDKYSETAHAANAEAIQQILKEAEHLKEAFIYDDMREDLDQILKDIQSGATRTVNIVNTLQAFSQSQQGKYQMANLIEGLNATLILLNNRMGDKVVVVKHFQDLPPIKCESGQLNQVFMNIINNAIQAMGYDGTLTISTENLKDSIKISFTDTGKGMDKQVRSHLFEPFFTTKDGEHNTGLGLSTAKEIVERHKGDITVRSEVGIGSTFTITLPKLADEQISAII